MKSLSLVIPAYGAGGLVGDILSHIPALAGTAADCGFSLVETIIVDDCGEPPLTSEELVPPHSVPLSILHNDRNMGKGYSVRRGALAAKGDWVLMSDVDESAPLTEFATLAPYSDHAIVCGSRCGGADRRPLSRRIMSRLFNMISGTGLKDSQCGFKLFNMSMMRLAFENLRTDRFAFDVELIRKAPSVAEVPVEWHGGRRSSLRLWRDAPRMLWDLVKIRLS